MDSKKRAIILDMDETLEHGIFKSFYVPDGTDAMMVLRPNLDKLISKLHEAKIQGIDIVLCTSAKGPWVERFLTLKPEFGTLFDKMLTRDNEEQWKNYDEETNPLEYEAKKEDYDLENLKPVTTFGYDSVLFIDDNKLEEKRLKRLFEITQGKLEKDVTYFSGFGFKGGSINLIDMSRYKKAASQNPEIVQKLEEYLELERNNPGCGMMCSVIDTFMNKKFTPGLTLADEEYSEKYEQFSEQLDSLSIELNDFAFELEEQTGDELFGYSDSELRKLEDYLATDKKYPYEGIEQPEVNKREQLNGLVEIAISTQKKLVEAQKLEEDYKKQQPKETEL